jgi:hypothetical protein
MVENPEHNKRYIYDPGHRVVSAACQERIGHQCVMMSLEDRGGRDDHWVNVWFDDYPRIISCRTSSLREL